LKGQWASVDGLRSGSLFRLPIPKLAGATAYSALTRRVACCAVDLVLPGRRVGLFACSLALEASARSEACRAWIRVHPFDMDEGNRRGATSLRPD